MRPGLRPLGIGELLDAAVAVYRRHFTTLLVQTAIVSVPLGALGLAVLLSAAPDAAGDPFAAFDADFGDANADDLWVSLAGGVAVSILGFLAAFLAAGLCARTCLDGYLSIPLDARATFGIGLRRVGGLLGAGLLVSALVTIGILACVIPGLVLMVYFALVPVALVIEGLAPGAAMGRAARLVRGRWWATAWFLVLAQLLFLVVDYALSLPLALLLELAVGLGNGVGAATVVVGLASMVATVLVVPFLSAALVVLYVDLRIRHEGFDVALAVHDLAGPEPSPAGSSLP